MNNKIVVDIDNTLWDFASVLWENLKKMNPQTPPPEMWHEWDFWKEYVSEKPFRKAIKEIHIKQDYFMPFSEAKSFLTALKDKGFHITIASHRESDTLIATRKWLSKYQLPFHDIHLSFDKSTLFDNCSVVVDDSPKTLAKAEKAGIMRAGLRYAWNAKEKHPLFNSLNEVFLYIGNNSNSK
jgi:FMN phosphatase YigB (HAD superfamily)